MSSNNIPLASSPLAGHPVLALPHSHSNDLLMMNSTIHPLNTGIPLKSTSSQSNNFSPQTTRHQLGQCLELQTPQYQPIQHRPGAQTDLLRPSSGCILSPSVMAAGQQQQLLQDPNRTQDSLKLSNSHFRCDCVADTSQPQYQIRSQLRTAHNSHDNGNTDTPPHTFAQNAHVNIPSAHHPYGSCMHHHSPNNVSPQYYPHLFPASQQHTPLPHTDPTSHYCTPQYQCQHSSPQQPQCNPMELAIFDLYGQMRSMLDKMGNLMNVHLTQKYCTPDFPHNVHQHPHTYGKGHITPRTLQEEPHTLSNAEKAKILLKKTASGQGSLGPDYADLADDVVEIDDEDDDDRHYQTAHDYSYYHKYKLPNNPTDPTQLNTIVSNSQTPSAQVSQAEYINSPPPSQHDGVNDVSAAQMALTKRQRREQEREDLYNKTNGLPPTNVQLLPLKRPDNPNNGKGEDCCNGDGTGCNDNNTHNNNGNSLNNDENHPLFRSHNNKSLGNLVSTLSDNQSLLDIDGVLNHVRLNKLKELESNSNKQNYQINQNIASQPQNGDLQNNISPHHQTVIVSQITPRNITGPDCDHDVHHTDDPIVNNTPHQPDETQNIKNENNDNSQSPCYDDDFFNILKRNQSHDPPQLLSDYNNNNFNQDSCNGQNTQISAPGKTTGESMINSFNNNVQEMLPLQFSNNTVMITHHSKSALPLPLKQSHTIASHSKHEKFITDSEFSQIEPVLANLKLINLYQEDIPQTAVPLQNIASNIPIKDDHNDTTEHEQPQQQHRVDDRIIMRSSSTSSNLSQKPPGISKQHTIMSDPKQHIPAALLHVQQQQQQQLSRWSRIRIGIDVGGTLAKICYFAPYDTTPQEQSLKQRLDSYLINHSTTGSVGSNCNDPQSNRVSGINLSARRAQELEVDSAVLRGKLHFVKFETTRIKSFFDLVHLDGGLSSLQVFATGGGAHKYRQEFLKMLCYSEDKDNQITSVHSEDHISTNQYTTDTTPVTEQPSTKLQPSFEVVDELQTLVRGLSFLIQNAPTSLTECFSFKRYLFHEELEMYTRPPPAFPFLLVNIGSGVSILRVDNERDYIRVGGSSLGGGTFLGLCRALTGCTSFHEALSLAHKGKGSKVDLLVNDIYGRDYSALGLSGDTIAASFGKLVKLGSGLSNDENTQISKDNANNKDFSFSPFQHGISREDLAKAALVMITNNICSLAHLYARQVLKVPSVVFVGNFLRNNLLAMRMLSYALAYWSNNTIEAIFLRHEGYFGSLGSILPETNFVRETTAVDQSVPTPQHNNSNTAPAPKH